MVVFGYVCERVGGAGGESGACVVGWGGRGEAREEFAAGLGFGILESPCVVCGGWLKGETEWWAFE